MSARKISVAPGEYYHVYSRGVDKRLIFLDDSDRKRFIRLLFLSNGLKPISYRDVKNRSLKDIDTGEGMTAIGAYCLMPNHFHLLVKELDNSKISKFMSKLLTAYSTYFNKKYQRTGSLFSSRYRISHLKSDEYLKYMFAYIHLNPLKILDPNWRDKIIDVERVKKYLKGYVYSSYLEYVGEERDEERLILNKVEFPKYFDRPHDFESEVLSWINFDKEYT